MKLKDILVMEESSLAIITKKIIKEVFGYKVYITEEIEDARKKIFSGKYAILMIEPYIFRADKILPLFLEKVKSKGVKVIAFTTQLQETLKRNYSLLQGKHYDSFLGKPAVEDELVSELKKVLKK